jgi:hypothetical protein
MMKFLIPFLFLIVFCSCKTTYRYDSIFTDKKEYVYQVLYIDNNGDTITNELLILKPLNRRWLGQPRVQESIKYIFDTDTNEYRNFKSPNPEMCEIDENYYIKKGKYDIKKSEITGGLNSDSIYYIHPPRTNQYFMLRYSAFPLIYYSKMKDTIQSYTYDLGLGMKYHHEYVIKPVKTINSDSLNEDLWEISAKSKITNLTEYWKNYPIFDSKTYFLFSKKHGFLKIHTEFENGIKVIFNMVKINCL